MSKTQPPAFLPPVCCVFRFVPPPHSLPLSPSRGNLATFSAVAAGCEKTNHLQTVVVLAIPLSTLKKLKFRRGASVTVILKNNETREFLTPQVGSQSDTASTSLAPTALCLVESLFVVTSIDLLL